MKGKLSRMLRSGLSLMLVFCMLVSMAPAAFATSGSETIKYVSLGDSMTNGYGLDGYTSNQNGYMVEVPEAYPYKLADKYGWELTQLATSGVRAEDIYSLLTYGDENAWPQDDYGKIYMPVKFSAYYNSSDPDTLFALAAKDFKKSVNEANVISVGVGSNNFATYITLALTSCVAKIDPQGMFGGSAAEFSSDWRALIAGENAELKAQINALYKEVYGELAAAAAEQGFDLSVELNDDYTMGDFITRMSDAAIYTTVGFMIGYAGIMDYIRENNSDAIVLLVGINNWLKGLKVVVPVGDQQMDLPIGDLLDNLYTVANQYVAGLPAAYEYKDQLLGVEPQKIHYAEVGVGSVELILEEVARKYAAFAAENPDAEMINVKGIVSDLTRERMIRDICAYVLTPMNGTSVSLDRKTVENFEAVYNCFNKIDFDSNEYKNAVKSLEEMGHSVLPKNAIEYTVTYLTGDFNAVPELESFGVEGLGTDPNVYNTMTPDIVGSCIAYTGIEQALIKTADVKNLYAQAFAVMAGEDGGLMNVVGKAFAEKLGDNWMSNSATTPKLIGEALTSNPTLIGLCQMFSIYILGEGVMCHPSAAGHEVVFNALVTAYESGKTVGDYTKEQIMIDLNQLYKLIETYGPEVLQGAYDYADENGYIEALEIALDTLKADLDAKTKEYLENVKPEIEAQIKALEEELATLEAELKELYLELSEKKAELEAAVGEGAEDLEDTIAQIEAAIAQIEKTIVTVEENINDIKGMIEGLQEDLAALGSELSDLGEAVVALEDAVEVLVNAIANSDGTIKAAVEAYEAARDAALAAVETVESIYKNIEEVVTEISTAAAEIVAGVEEVYNFVATELNALLESLPEDVKAQIEAAAAEIQAKAEEEIAKLNEELQKQIEALEAELAAKAEELKAAAKAEADKLWAAANEEITKIEAEIAAKKAELESAIGAQKAELEAQIKALEEQLAAKKAEIESQIAELDKQIADLYAQLENASEELKAEIESQIAALEAQKAELQAQLESVTAQIQAEIEKKIAELEALGAEIKAQIAELEAKIEEIKAATEQAAAELMAKAEEEIAKLNEELQAKVEELKAEVAAKIEEIKAAAEEQIEKLGTEISEEIAELIDAVVSGSQEAIEEAIANVETAVENAAQEAFVAAVEQIESLVDFAEEKVNEIVDAFEDAYVGATTDDYEIDENSYYVALGDGSAVSESYVDGVAAELNVPFKNLSKNGQTIEQAPEYIVANAAEIQKADLITVGYGNNAFAQKAVDRAYKALMGKPVETYDWSNFVGEEGAAYVAQALEDIKAELAAQGMNVTIPGYKTDMASAATLAVEAYAYATVEYLYNMPTVIGTIREINPDAVVIIVGMYNPLADATLKFENVSIEIGDYLDYLVEGADVYGTGFCMLSPNAIYVAAPDAQTNATAKEHDLLAFLTEYLVEGGVMMNPNEKGHTYIQNQILKALNVTVVEEEEPAGLWGDADNNGKVNLRDVMLVLAVANQRDVEINRELADVTGDGKINLADTMWILKRANQHPDLFPVEK